MRTRDAFRDALLKIAAFQPRQSEAPAFSFTPGTRLPSPQRSAGGPGHQSVPPASGGRTITGAARDLSRGAVTAVELAEEAYAAIEARSASLNAFTFVRPRDEALREAAGMDGERRAGRPGGPLQGIPFSVKDVIHVAGMPTSASSAVMDGGLEPADAAAVARLRAAGALFVGKTSTHEFALGVTTPQSRNPWDPARLAGGSSGGSAIALATGMCLGSLGTDTRASIRVPAALSGVVGFKATYGLIPTDGVVTLSWSMDHASPMAKSVEDVAILLDVLVAGPSNGAGSFSAAVGAPVAKRVGVPVHGLSGADPAVAAAFAASLDRFRGLGAAIVELDEPDEEDFALANAAGLIVSRVEAAAYHEPWRGRGDRYTPDVRDQLDEARHVLGIDYLQAQRWRAGFLHRMERLFERCDVLALPTSKVPAPYPEEGDAMLLVLSENCVPWSFIGFPAVSLPCGAAPGNLPVGLQLVAPPFADHRLISLGAAFESVAGVSYAGG